MAGRLWREQQVLCWDCATLDGASNRNRLKKAPKGYHEWPGCQSVPKRVSPSWALRVPMCTLGAGVRSHFKLTPKTGSGVLIGLVWNPKTGSLQLVIWIGGVVCAGGKRARGLFGPGF